VVRATLVEARAGRVSDGGSIPPASTYLLCGREQSSAPGKSIRGNGPQPLGRLRE